MAYDINKIHELLEELRGGELSSKDKRREIYSKSEQIRFSKISLALYKNLDDNRFEGVSVHLRTLDPVEGGLGTTLADNPFIGAFDAPNTPPNTVRQSVEVVCDIEYGHEGAAIFCKGNIPVGQSVKSTFVGAFMRLSAYLEPKYWPRFDISGGAGGPFGYISTNDIIRNAIWNGQRDPSADLLNGNLPQAVIDAIQRTPIQVNSILACGAANIGQGAAYDFGERITRRFSGTVPAGAVGAASRVLCPVAWNSGTVQLISDQSTTVFGDIQPSADLALAFRLYNGQEIYNYYQRPGAGFKPNQRVAVPAGTVAVLVYAQALPVRETPFELVWDLGF